MQSCTPETTTAAAVSSSSSNYDGNNHNKDNNNGGGGGVDAVMMCIVDRKQQQRYSLLVRDTAFLRAFAQHVLTAASDDGLEVDVCDFTRLLDRVEEQRGASSSSSSCRDVATTATTTSSSSSSTDTATVAAAAAPTSSPSSPSLSAAGLTTCMTHTASDSATAQRAATTAAPPPPPPTHEQQQQQQQPHTQHVDIGETLAASIAVDSSLFFAVAREAYELSRDPFRSSSGSSSSNAWTSLNMTGSGGGGAATTTTSAVAGGEGSSNSNNDSNDNNTCNSRSGGGSGGRQVWRLEGHCAAFRCCVRAFARVYGAAVMPVVRPLASFSTSLRLDDLLRYRRAVWQAFRLPHEDPSDRGSATTAGTSSGGGSNNGSNNANSHTTRSESNVEMKWVSDYICNDRYFFPTGPPNASTSSSSPLAGTVAVAATTATTATATTTTVGSAPVSSAYSSSSSSSSATPRPPSLADITLSYIPATRRVAQTAHTTSNNNNTATTAMSAATTVATTTHRAAVLHADTMCSDVGKMEAAAVAIDGAAGSAAAVDVCGVVAATTAGAAHTSASASPTRMTARATTAPASKAPPQLPSENETQTFWLTQLLQNATWEADEAVTQCRDCGRVFAGLTRPLGARAHHCRRCGRRLCGACVTHRAHRSFATLSKPSGDAGGTEGEERLVCHPCFAQYQALERLRYLGALFAMAGLDFCHLALCRTVNVQWRQAAELCISEYRFLLHTCLADFHAVLTPVGVFLQNSLGLIAYDDDNDDEDTDKDVATTASGEKSGAAPALPVAAPSATAASLSLPPRGLHAEAALLLLKYIAEEGLWQAASTQRLLALLPRRVLKGGKLRFSHWHFYCTAFCHKMRPAYFYLRAVEWLCAAPPSCSAAATTAMTLTHRVARLLTSTLRRATATTVTSPAAAGAQRHVRTGATASTSSSSSSSSASAAAAAIAEVEFVTLWLLDLLYKDARCKGVSVGGGGRGGGSGQAWRARRCYQAVLEVLLPALSRSSPQLAVLMLTSFHSLRGGYDEELMSRWRTRILSELDATHDADEQTSSASRNRSRRRTTTAATTTAASSTTSSLSRNDSGSNAKIGKAECDDDGTDNGSSGGGGGDSRNTSSTSPPPPSTTTMRARIEATLEFLMQLDAYCAQHSHVSGAMVTSWLWYYCSGSSSSTASTYMRATAAGGGHNSSSMYSSSSDGDDDTTTTPPPPRHCGGGAVAAVGGTSSRSSALSNVSVASASAMTHTRPPPPRHATRNNGSLCSNTSSTTNTTTPPSSSSRVFLDLPRPLCDPFWPAVTLRSVHLSGIQVEQASSTQPVWLTFSTYSNAQRAAAAAGGTAAAQQPPERLYSFLYKRENVERDQLMCVSARMLHLFLQGEMAGAEVATYRVLPLSYASGLIEKAEGYVLSRLPGLTPNIDLTTYICQRGDVARRNFYASSKLFLLLNYIFSIGDRHQGNVMISPRGSILHIDFGFIFSERTLLEKLAGTSMRVDYPFLAAIAACRHNNNNNNNNNKSSSSGGGSSSGNTAADHDEYFHEAAEWFLLVRAHAEVFMRLWLYAVHRGSLRFGEQELAVTFNTLFDRHASPQASARNFASTMRYSINVCRLKDVTHSGMQALRAYANRVSRTVSDSSADALRSLGVMWSRWVSDV